MTSALSLVDSVPLQNAPASSLMDVTEISPNLSLNNLTANPTEQQSPSSSSHQRSSSRRRLSRNAVDKKGLNSDSLDDINDRRSSFRSVDSHGSYDWVSSESSNSAHSRSSSIDRDGGIEDIANHPIVSQVVLGSEGALAAERVEKGVGAGIGMIDIVLAVILPHAWMLL